MAAAKRYWNIFRESPSGRERKRLLNRARSCQLCGKPLSTDRGLFRAYTGFMEFGLVVAHAACPGEYLAEMRARDETEEAERAARSERFAAEARVRSRLIVVSAALPSVRPAAPWQMP